MVGLLAMGLLKPDAADFAGHTKTVAAPMDAFFAALGWQRVIPGKNRVPYLRQLNDVPPAEAARQCLAACGIVEEYGGAIAADSAAARFLATCIWSIRCKPAHRSSISARRIRWW